MFGRRNVSERPGCDLSFCLVPRILGFTIEKLEKLVVRANHVAAETLNAKTTLTDLPNDVVFEILLRLPVKSLCCFKCVSKRSSTIIGSPLFGRLHTPRLLDSRAAAAPIEVPQLMLLAESITWGYNHKTMAWQLELSKYNDKSYILRRTKNALLVTRFPNSYSVCSIFCNLFLFKREWENGGPFFLLNPLGGQVLKIPTIVNFSSSKQYGDGRTIAEWYGIGFDSTTNSYKIVRVCHKVQQFRTLMVSQVHVLGANSWREIHSAPPCELSGNKASAYGNMHWFVYESGETQHNHIISFDFEKEEFFWTPHPKVHFSRHVSNVHLLNLRGSLTIVDLSSYDSIDIWVMLNDKKKWMLDYKVDCREFEEQPLRHSIETCGAWEHGIFLKEENDRVYVLDLRHESMKVVSLPALPSGFLNPRIFSYTGSLISLKNYGNLVEAEKTGLWQNFRNLVEEPRTGTWNFD